MQKFYLLKQTTSRNRLLLIGCILAVIGLGLASRKYSFLFSDVFGIYPGDALWSLMVYFGWAFLKPTASPYRIAIYAFITSFLDELSQLIQVPWLNEIRHTTIGHLILGTVFSWNDIIAYTVGIMIGVILEIVILSARQSST